MESMAVQRIHDVLILLAIEGKASVKSVNAMLKPSIELLILKVIVHAAIISDVGRPFYIVTYLTEGGDTLIFTQYTI